MFTYVSIGLMLLYDVHVYNFIQSFVSVLIQVVITWLERGDCNKKNVNVFYSMIQSTNSHVRRLLNEKTQYDEEIQRAKEEAKQKMQGILSQCKLPLKRTSITAYNQKKRSTIQKRIKFISLPKYLS